MSDGTDLRGEFLLDPSVTFLNHGSFGACPREVIEHYQEWQLELEREPVLFIARRLEELLAEARAAVGAYVGADPDDLVFVPNATAGVNVAAWASGLESGDEVLSTNLEYGALDLTWQHVCRERDARYARMPIRLPVESSEEIVESIWAGVGSRTRVLFLSHHTSGTALTLPVAELCARARERGIRTIVDGAHAPGQLPLDLRALDADYYAGNCHKSQFLLRQKGPGDTCSDGSPNEARRHSLGPSPALLHASARLRVPVRCLLDAPPREHAQREDSCGEARIWVRNCSRGLAHREERYPADRSFFAPEEEPASGPGSDPSRAEIGRDEVDAAPPTEGPGKGPSSLHGAC